MSRYRVIDIKLCQSYTKTYINVKWLITWLTWPDTEQPLVEILVMWYIWSHVTNILVIQTKWNRQNLSRGLNLNFGSTNSLNSASNHIYLSFGITLIQFYIKFLKTEIWDNNIGGNQLLTFLGFSLYFLSFYLFIFSLSVLI